LTVGRESYQQVDSEKIITARYLEEIQDWEKIKATKCLKDKVSLLV
jgi:hypothetical protein